jgi:hydroxymethylpyrimidine pyrophosphatase-like HAD family hydrolase
MKRTAILVNTSRGPVVDEAALVDALNGRKLAGAGLDVYEREPAVHPGLLQMPNVVLAPHIASATVRSRSEIGHGRPQHGDGCAWRAPAEPRQPRGQEIALALRYKLLALDLDGTILGLDLSLDPRDIQAVHDLRAAGMSVIVCTGRPFPGATPWVEKLGLGGPIVCYQGAQVRELDGQCLTTACRTIHGGDPPRPRTPGTSRRTDDQLIVERDRGAGQARRGRRHVVPDLDVAMDPTTPKLVIVAAPELLEALLPEARRMWAGRLNVATSTPDYLEFTSVESDKAAALRFVCGRFGITQDEVVAVGDGRNDESMIEWAGLGFVEGSPPEVVAAADHIRAGPRWNPTLVEALLN